jgi:hypothetical protein
VSFVRIDPVQLAVREGLLSETDLPRAREVQLDRGGPLARVCVDMGYLDDRALASALARVLNLPRSDLRQIDIDPQAFGRVPRAVLESVSAVPFQLRQDGKVLVVAVADPQDERGLLRLRELSGLQLKVTVAGYREIEGVLAQYARTDGPTDPELMAQSVREPTHPGEMIFDLSAIGRDAAGMEAEQAAPVNNESEHLKALAKTMKQSSKALRAALDLCVERDLISMEDIATAMKRGK